MRHKSSSLRSSARRLAGRPSGDGVDESERFLRHAEQAFNAEDSQRLAVQEILERLVPSNES
ncbi:MAG: hypothetical protein H6710_07045 [Myxococcales bacterium]|nr:hypothetical protein [Myxococcales bacterium]MCB9704694.1 hypothetical protein [Myxococcales bacterium]